MLILPFFFAGVAVLGGNFLFDGEFLYFIGLAGAVLILFEKDLKGFEKYLAIIIYAVFFALISFLYGITIG